ncbi:VanW family protein [Lacrimispora sp.]|uniref:VanW family protein n=1 Tax=Lacrimispora sp. TaxID=2719234 RepID=UPI00345FE608
MIFGAFSIGLVVFLLSSISKGKEKPEETVLKVEQQSKRNRIEEETVTKILKEMKVDNISLTDLDRKEAKKKLLDLYSWNLGLKYKEQTITLINPLPEMIDELLDRIYTQAEGGEYILDMAGAEESVKLQVAEAASKWNKKPVNAQLTGRDNENNRWIYSEGENGILIDEEKTVQEIMRMVMQKNFEGVVETEVREEVPSLTASQAKEEYQVIGTFTTIVTDNQNRNNNIKLAVNALDGLVIFPEEEFSFNKTTGNRTIERGYKPAGAYRNGEFVEEPGGGVCQVSSTLYNAIILSGIATTERHPHSFEPSYVIPGEDAMVSYDGYSGPDLRFINKDNTSVALRAVFKDKKITISIIARPILEKGVTISMRSEKVKEYDPPESNYEEDQTLQLDQEVVVTQGIKGTTWKTYLITSKDGIVVKEVYFHTSTYKGKPGLVKRNSSGTVIPAETKEVAEETSAEQSAGEKQTADDQALQEDMRNIMESQPAEETSEFTVIPPESETAGSGPQAIGPGVE